MLPSHREALVQTEALFELAFCRALVCFVPFHKWSTLCGHPRTESLKMGVPASEAKVRSIRSAIRRVARHVPWKSVCLDQAMAAQRMLSRRRLSSTLYFGMEKSLNGEWNAHAWVRCGSEWVIGYEPERHFTVVGTYATLLGRD